MTGRSAESQQLLDRYPGIEIERGRYWISRETGRVKYIELPEKPNESRFFFKEYNA